MYVSLKDVAARAGVSFQTASKVLNGQAGVVSERTHVRILEAATELGYVPNAMARGLVRQMSPTIGILVDDYADPALSQFVQSAQRAATAEGQLAMIVTPGPDTDPEPAVRKLREHRVGGILVIAPSLEEDPRLGAALRGPLPVVSMNHIHGGGVPLVGSDHVVTGTLAAEHLLELGHRRIATITGLRNRRVVRSRHRGFRDALNAAGWPLARRLAAEGDWTMAGAHAAAMRLLEEGPAFTAVFVHSDVMAVGVLRALHDCRLRVPEDCSVVGCDDLDLGAFLIPSLSSVHIPFAETGALAAALLIRLIRGEATPAHQLSPTHLVVRQSTAPPPAASRQTGRAGPATRKGEG